MDSTLQILPANSALIYWETMTLVTNVSLESPTIPVTSQQPGVGKIKPLA